jgi:hypothetical protein
VLALPSALTTVLLALTPTAMVVDTVPKADIGVTLDSVKVTMMTINPKSGQFLGDTGIGYVTVTYHTHNYGPNVTPQVTVYRDITAPPGTVFMAADEKYFRQYSTMCKTIVAHTHVRCLLYPSFVLDSSNGGNGPGAQSQRWTFILKKKCTSPGRLKFDYGNDPKTSNNSVTVRLKVPGAATACAPKPPSPKPVALASPSPTAAAPSPSLTEPSVEPTGEATATDVAVLAGLWLFGRRRRDPAADTEL